MTATNARMTLIQIGDQPDDTMLLSEAEIAELRAAWIARAQEGAAKDDQPPTAAGSLDLPDFNATDETILARQPQAAAPRDGAAPLNQRLIILIGGLIAALILLALSALSGSDRRATLPLAPTTAAAAPTAAPTAAATLPPATMAAPESTVGAYFDYANPASATTITTSGILRVAGQADSWRLVALSAHRPSVWVRLADLPSGVPVANPLPDLAVRPTPSPPPPRQPASSVGGADDATPAQCATEADIRFTAEHDVRKDGRLIGHVVGRSCFSQAEADQRAAARDQVVIAEYLANPTATPLPSATPIPLSLPTPRR